jgi:bifunctional DNA-binding transcriptional regulator/antitoxin component of YhaV-PrlF toxin-antitoxin module
MEYNIIKIVEVKPRTRITLPKSVQDQLKVQEGDHIAFIRETPGIRIVKVVLDLDKEGENGR